MAQIKKPLFDDGPVNAGEQRLLNYLEVNLPEDYIIVPNLNMPITNNRNVMRYWEYDCIVVAPHALFHIENKDWGGELIGDDNVWFVNGMERGNPHKTAGLKSRILATKIKNLHPIWRFGQIWTLVSLSHPRQSKFGLNPHCDSYKQTFILNKELIDFLTKPDLVGCRPNAIKDIQMPIAEMLCGELDAKKQKEKREYIFNYHILDTLQETETFTEYLCVPKFLQTSYYKIREYPLDNADLSPEELKKHVLKLNDMMQRLLYTK